MSIVPSSQVTRSGNGVVNGNVSSSQTLADSYGVANVPGHLPPGVDIWGAFERRKYLVLLLGIVGAGLGYLNFTKTPASYSSNTKLLIVTQAPPAIVDGNFRLEHQTSLDKHQSLLSSELVLSSAVERGNLGTLPTFAGVRNPVGELKQMLRVVPSSKEAITLSCSGPVPDDLPVILNWIVNAYEHIIAEDSQNVSDQTVELVEKLAGELSDEKDRAEAQRLKLWRQLDLDTISDTGRVSNPHTPKLRELNNVRDQLEQELSDISVRMNRIRDSFGTDDDEERKSAVDPLQIKVVGIEARDYLGLGPSQAMPDGGLDMTYQSQLNAKLSRLDTSIFEVQSQLLARSRRVGPGHPEIQQLNRQLRMYEREHQATTKALTNIEDGDNVEGGTEITARDQQRRDFEKFREQENKEWIRMYYLALENRRSSLSLKLDQTKAEIEEVSKVSSEVADKIVQLNMLQKKVETKDQEASVVLDRLKELNVLANNYTMTKVRTLDTAKNGYKVGPSLPKNIAMGAMLALLAGLGLAIVIDQSELSFRSPEEVRDRLELPVVGKIPRIKTARVKAAKGSPTLITSHKPGSSAAEAFRNTRTSLFFRANGERIKSVMITSPSPGDGKSTMAGNLAISIAQAGKRVILVDADFRRPRIDQYFGEDLSGGVVDILAGKIKLRNAIKPTELQDGLHLLTAGGRPQNPGELVTSTEFRRLIDSLQEHYDFVIIDAPPILPVADPASIASLVDGVMMVMRIRRGGKLTAKKAKDALEQVGANWLGVIINDMDENPHYHEYGYQYGYSYYGTAYGRYYESTHSSYHDKARIEAKARQSV